MPQPPFSPVAVAKAAAIAAGEVPDVVDLHAGAVGEIATYGTGGPVRGVRVRRPPDPRVRIHVVARFGARLDEGAEAVRERVAGALAQHAPSFADTPVDVHIADVRASDGDRDRRAVDSGVVS